MENVFFRNAAPYPAEIFHVAPNGEEVSHGLLSSGLRRKISTLQGDVWRARAVRPGHKGDRRLMIEHQIKKVELHNCNCPEIPFKDCSEDPFKGPRWTASDPVVFENIAGMPVDVFWWNGTCESLMSWRDPGGLMPGLDLYLDSTHGHNFRIRSADPNSRRFLMQHTINDLVLRGCNEEDEREEAYALNELEAEVAEMESENDAMRDRLSDRLSELVHALEAVKLSKKANTTRTSAKGLLGASVVAGGQSQPFEIAKGATASLLGLLSFK